VIDFFKKIFHEEDNLEPNLVFGRFTDFYKEKSKFSEWDTAIDLHQKKSYFPAIRHFFKYLTDDTSANVHIEDLSSTKMKFHFFQGSKKIDGFVNEDGFFAESKIAHCDKISIAAMRSLLEENYHLKYCSYALDSEENLTIVMQTDFLDGSPYKLYFGLKELATRADRRDDVMIRKFPELSSIVSGSLSHIDDKEKEIKFNYIQSAINYLLIKVEQDADKLHNFPGLVSYKILSTIFCIDYFVKPEGMTMEHIENIHKTFFTVTTISPEKKNNEMLKELKKIQLIGKKDLFNEMYNTKSTFGNLVAGNHKRYQELFESEMKHFQWYMDNGYKDYVLDIPNYIAGLLLYTYSMPLPDKYLLHILLRVLNNDLFVSLGFTSFIRANGSLDKKKIIASVEEKFKSFEDSYKNLDFDASNISFENLYTFAYSYMSYIYQLNLEKNE
jgi:hypothetical protein